jgi:alcohol dehydrogenase class IV
MYPSSQMPALCKFVTTPAIHHGPGAINRLVDLVKQYGGRPCLITDPGVAKVGLTERVFKALGGEIPCYSEVEAEPSYTRVNACVDFIKASEATMVIGLGGGSALDCAKMAAVLTCQPGSVIDYFGVDKVPDPGLPMIAIPTTAGTGSEVSPAAVFVDDASQRKTGVRSDYMQPKAALLDPELTLSLPQSITASTGMDALTHAIECYTARASTAYSDLFAEQAIVVISRNLPIAYANGQDLFARNEMLMGAYLAGLALAIANVGAVHALAQTLGGIYRVAHGVGNALFLPPVMAFNRIGCKARYARVAELMGARAEGMTEDEASNAAVEAVAEMSAALGIPQRLRDLNVGIAKPDLENVAKQCIATQQRIIVNNPRALSEADALALLRQSY